MRNNKIAIGQGGGPTAVINDQLAGALYEAKKAGLMVYALKSGLEGILHADAGNVINITHWNPNDVRAAGPGAVLHSTRIKLKKGENEGDIEKIRNNLDRYGIGSLVYFGGNDSSDALQAIGIGVHGSKTIDNDLPYAHHVSGFGSANLFNATMIRNIARDIGSFRVIGSNGSASSYLTAPVTVYQTMGRDTGWLALATAFARVDANGIMSPKLPPDIIWPREVPFDEEAFLSALSNVLYRKGKAMVVIGEELVGKDGKTLSETYREREQDINLRVLKILEKENIELYNQFTSWYGMKEFRDQHGHVEHARSGAFSYAAYVAKLVKEKLRVSNIAKIKETPLEPQHLQRAAYVKSEVDAREAFEVGREAVRAILDGDEQVSVIITSNGHGPLKLERIPISLVAGKTRHVPLEYIDGIRGPTQEFVDEFLPTIGGAKALPHYVKLEGKAVNPLY